MTRIATVVAHGSIASLIAAMLLSTGASASGTAEPRQATKSKLASLQGDAHLIAQIRKLSELQQRVAEGDKASLSEQLALARDIAQMLRQKPASAWRSAREWRSIIKFVLSGGDPSALGQLVATGSLPESEATLARAVIAYSRGDKSGAEKLFDTVDHRAIGSSLAGHVALVKAVIASQSSASKALALCREAVLLSPGTHIEEAALRLLISIAITSGDARAVERAHVRHLLRFPHSLYARDIDARVARVLVASANPDASELNAMVKLPELIPPARRRAFFAQLAEAGIRGGKPAIALRAARIALLPPLTPPEVEAESPASLLAIEGAALVLTSDRSGGLRRLAEAHAAGPGAEISDLITEAQSLAGMIEAPPVPPLGNGRSVDGDKGRPALAASSSSQSMRSPADFSRYEAVVSRGNDALATADKLIQQAQR